ncbi:hypothetical protein [Agromyces aerolatus]|uniref:hypothetical protein n=1 Tax=Agromyces sp. LY-1074 TaxID=3074080 RepID=UPI002865A90D|nr:MULTISPECIES: hypothetical protein [unclassified Agromyces]MDR5699023.1 hypothetical protein [Agromyces sp. LY-1074]MDR5705199.1 hypothetical protein [Agromyces sp. LY-1358]
MLFSTLTVDGRDHHLPQDSDVEALKAKITEVAHEGGGFVDLPYQPGHTTSVFVGEATRMRIDIYERDDEGADGADAASRPLSSLDLTWDFELDM